MKNKKNIYILLPVVVLVWGLVGYRIFSTITPKTNLRHQITAFSFTPEPLQELDNFTIQANYRDPFLGTLEKPHIVNKAIKKVEQLSPKEPFPEIQFKGLVSGNGNSRSVFIININGQQYFFKDKATYEHVKLIRGSNKKVLLRFQGQHRTFSLTK